MSEGDQNTSLPSSSSQDMMPPPENPYDYPLMPGAFIDSTILPNDGNDNTPPEAMDADPSSSHVNGGGSAHHPASTNGNQSRSPPAYSAYPMDNGEGSSRGPNAEAPELAYTIEGPDPDYNPTCPPNCRCYREIDRLREATRSMSRSAREDAIGRREELIRMREELISMREELTSMREELTSMREEWQRSRDAHAENGVQPQVPPPRSTMRHRR
jgi:hypothetical protein